MPKLVITVELPEKFDDQLCDVNCELVNPEFQPVDMRVLAAALGVSIAVVKDSAKHICKQYIDRVELLKAVRFAAILHNHANLPLPEDSGTFESLIRDNNNSTT